jgi:hypothetical protein
MPIPGVGAVAGHGISKDAIVMTLGGVVAAYLLWRASQPTPAQGTPSVVTGGTPISPGGAVDNGAGLGAPAAVVGSGAFHGPGLNPPMQGFGAGGTSITGTPVGSKAARS